MDDVEAAGEGGVVVEAASESLDKADRPDDNGGVAVAGRQRETHMGFVRSLATIAFIIALPVAIITTNIRLLLNAPLIYDYAFDRYNAEETTGLSRADLDACAAELREYFNSSEPTYYCTVTQNGLPTSIFSARETQHMEDVKALVSKKNVAQIASVMFVVAYGIVFFVWWRDSDVRQLASQALIGLLFGALAVGAVGVLVAVGFDATWERFHEIAFTNELWLLNPRTDHLIQMFPEVFWRDAIFILAGLCLLEAAAIAAVSGIYVISSRGPHRHISGSIAMNATTRAA
jgi:integral membrane protein (TIGR01906 family)